MWEKFEFNTPYDGEDITEINGVPLPRNYLDFMRQHNGGEGDTGETWLALYPLEELRDINDDYEISEALPGHIIIGGNGGEEFYGIDADGMFFNVPSTFDRRDLTILCDDMAEFADKVNQFWAEL